MDKVIIYQNRNHRIIDTDYFYILECLWRDDCWFFVKGEQNNILGLVRLLKRIGKL